jgi:hypothetical protein
MKGDGSIMTKQRFTTAVVILMISGGFGASHARAGSAAIGSVAGSLNASLGGQALLANTVIFGGDRLDVKDGAAVIALQRGNRMAFGRDTQATFLRDANGIGIVLESGNVSIYHPAAGGAVRVAAGRIVVRPLDGYKSLGEVAMWNGVVLVTAKEGSLRVGGEGRSVELAQGKSLCIQPGAMGFPQGGPATNAGAPPAPGVRSGQGWRLAELAAGGTGIVLGAVAIGKAGSSKTTANSALSTAEAAASAASAASAAATAAAQAAAAASSAAAASLNLDQIANNVLGCKLNVLANELGQASPYTPPPGFSCAP